MQGRDEVGAARLNNVLGLHVLHRGTHGAGDTFHTELGRHHHILQGVGTFGQLYVGGLRRGNFDCVIAHKGEDKRLVGVGLNRITAIEIGGRTRVSALYPHINANHRLSVGVLNDARYSVALGNSCEARP